MRFHLDFQNKQLTSLGTLVGTFTPKSRTAGTLALGTKSYDYLFYGPYGQGYNLGLYRSGGEIANLWYHWREGGAAVRTAGGNEYRLDTQCMIYGRGGVLGKSGFDVQGAWVDLEAPIPPDEQVWLAVIVVLDIMWANQVGFTRTRPLKPLPEP